MIIAGAKRGVGGLCPPLHVLALALLVISCRASGSHKGARADGTPLTPLQYSVIRNGETETPFENAYWNNHDEGIYVDLITGDPLFSSTDKFDSGTGWPSFTRLLVPQNVETRVHREFFIIVTEVRSRGSGGHLGHVFADGPPPTGLRYCVNSAALRFVPAGRLEAEGYARFRPLFPHPKR